MLQGVYVDFNVDYITVPHQFVISIYMPHAQWSWNIVCSPTNRPVSNNTLVSTNLFHNVSNPMTLHTHSTGTNT